MGLVDDILKGLPVNPLLREKIAELEAKYAATETENSILRDDLRNAKAENQKLKQQAEKLSHKDDLDEIELKILVRVSKIDYSHCVAGVIQDNFFQDLSLERVKYHLKRLEDFEYARGGVVGRFGTQYALTQAGRKLLLDKGLL